MRSLSSLRLLAQPARQFMAIIGALVFLGASVNADVAPPPRLVSRPVPPALLPEGYEVVVFAPHRPIRVKVTIRYAGKPLSERWAEALRTSYQGFDRNGDGVLTDHEVKYIFSDASLAQLVRSGFYSPNPADMPTLDKLDLNGDRRVSFEEFAVYYKTAAARAVHAFPPSEEAPFNAQTTESIFQLMDQNKDDKLTRVEVQAIEKLLATRDADEDECLSVNEIVQNNRGNARQFEVQLARNQAGANRTPQNVAVYNLCTIPGTITQRILKQYDKNNDFELTAAESDFDAATFARLDLNGNGQLSGEELDAWRTGSPDLEVTLSLAAQTSDCQARITTDAKLVASRGFTWKSMESGRMMIHHGRQPIEFWTFAAAGRNGAAIRLKQTFGAMFQQVAGAKGYIEDKDFIGAKALQFQQIRVIVDPADFNSDGKLTKEEFDKYFDLQQHFVDLGVGLTPTVQTPTLFQLLDVNRDGRLGIRELRTAWPRLRSLEPSRSDGTPDVVTRAAIQPSVSIRMSRTFDRGAINQVVFFENPNQVRTPQKGPAWFRKMDRNADGDVSRLEFLGTRSEFDGIDADRDDLISLEEAESFDTKSRR